MCTVVVRWAQGSPVLLLALRDELTGRPFDDPGTWWPDRPALVGGRDRQAGGSWCVTDTASGTSALVLNRRQRTVAAPMAPSRGVLPLLAAEPLQDWPRHLDLDGMASFALVLAAPDRLTVWEFDGQRLTSADLPAGTSMVTAGPADEDKIARHLPVFQSAGTAAQWQAVVAGSTATDEPTSLLVHVERDDLTYATVIAQVIEAQPGRVQVRYSRTPAADWTERSWP
ncbi:MAG TPA: NRDE family protein [Mycobacteriales bacterium]|jgi:hypothetical protein|nr:NRDE family protein [Mycobacteriales bacterium]